MTKIAQNKLIIEIILRIYCEHFQFSLVEISGHSFTVNNLKLKIMAKIEKLWFASGRVWITTDKGETLSRPLEAFPTLKDATEPQRLSFEISRFADSIRWEEIDEDIHISIFYDTEEPDYDNEIARIFRRFP